jgi:hypothetical protein
MYHIDGLIYSATTGECPGMRLQISYTFAINKLSISIKVVEYILFTLYVVLYF